MAGGCKCAGWGQQPIAPLKAGFAIPWVRPMQWAVLELPTRNYFIDSATNDLLLLAVYEGPRIIARKGPFRIELPRPEPRRVDSTCRPIYVAALPHFEANRPKFGRSARGGQPVVQAPIQRAIGGHRRASPPGTPSSPPKMSDIPA